MFLLLCFREPWQRQREADGSSTGLPAWHMETLPASSATALVLSSTSNVGCESMMVWTLYDWERLFCPGCNMGSYHRLVLAILYSSRMRHMLTWHLPSRATVHFRGHYCLAQAT